MRSYATLTALITAFIAPLAAQTAKNVPITTAMVEPALFPAAVSCARSIASITAPGATVPRNSFRSS